MTKESLPIKEGLSVTIEDISRLSPREREVFEYLSLGIGIQDVASRLDLRTKTVDAHKTNIMKKLGVHSRMALVFCAIHHNIIEVPVKDQN